MKKILIIILLCILVGCTNNEYKLIFETNGAGSIPSIIIPKDLEVEMPMNPILEGYSFCGWYLDNTYNNIFFTSYLKKIKIDKDIKLYAKWVINKYSISFEENGGSEVTNIFGDYGTVISKPNDPIKVGYRFVGWYTDKELTKEFTFSTIPAYNVTLFAKWDGNYHINYNIIESDGFSSYILLDEQEKVTNITYGTSHALSISSLGKIYSWGNNSKGQIGDNSTVNKLFPTEINKNFNLYENEKIIKVSSGDDHSAALTNLGRMFTWGDNSFGQLGDNSKINQNFPIDITNQFNLNNNEKIIDISLGYRRSTAITSNGRIFAWGVNNLGQLGDGTTENRIQPIDITSYFKLNYQEEVIDIAIGYGHTLAITTNGRIFTWGINNYGQLGDESTITRNTPTDITSQFSLAIEEEIVDISLGSFHSSVVTSLGRIFTWGNNSYGQLGDNTQVIKKSPIDITNMFNLSSNEFIIDVSLGTNHTGAITSKGRIFMWGDNLFCQLGDQTNKNKIIPTDITNNFSLNNGEIISKISLGGNSSSIITSINRIFSWGANTDGQLGDGTEILRNIPSRIPFISLRVLKIETYEVASTIDQFIPTHDIFTFDGWYLDKELTNKYVYGTMPANDFNLYGKWNY